jgi:hypothetical protein
MISAAVKSTKFVPLASEAAAQVIVTYEFKGRLLVKQV